MSVSSGEEFIVEKENIHQQGTTVAVAINFRINGTLLSSMVVHFLKQAFQELAYPHILCEGTLTDDLLSMILSSFPLSH